MNDTREMRDEKVRREKMSMFPRKSKGKFEKTAARSTDRNKYRKDFNKVKK